MQGSGNARVCPASAAVGGMHRRWLQQQPQQYGAAQPALLTFCSLVVTRRTTSLGLFTMRYSPSSSVVRLALFSMSSMDSASPGTTWSAPGLVLVWAGGSGVGRLRRRRYVPQRPRAGSCARDAWRANPQQRATHRPGCRAAAACPGAAAEGKGGGGAE